MQKHIRVFKDYYHLGEQDYMVCQYCKEKQAVDIHHIDYRSQQGKDDIENLIGLCRSCHNKVHAGEIEPDKLRDKIKHLFTGEIYYESED